MPAQGGRRPPSCVPRSARPTRRAIRHRTPWRASAGLGASLSVAAAMLTFTLAQYGHWQATARRSKIRCVKSFLLLAALLFAGGVHAESASCADEEGLHFICGPVASEDLVQVPGTRWLIASGLN